MMKKRLLITLLAGSFMLLTYMPAQSQCSICTRTAQQLGERPAKALNGGIIYLAFTPLLLVGVIGYRWWRSNHDEV